MTEEDWSRARRKFEKWEEAYKLADKLSDPPDVYQYAKHMTSLPHREPMSKMKEMLEKGEDIFVMRSEMPR